MPSFRSLGALAAVLFCTTALPAQDFTFIVPPGFETTDGDASLSRPLRLDASTMQFAFSASMLSLQPGSPIGGLQFRLDSSSGPGTVDAVWTDYTVILSGSLFAVGSLSTNFGSNIAGDAVTVRSGALTIPAFSMIGNGSGSTPSDFGFLLQFDNQYVYAGGDLLVTIIHTGGGISQNVDGQTLPGTQFLSAAGYGTSTATTNLGVAPVVQFTVVPEPASVFAGALTAGALGLTVWRRRRAAVAV